MQTLQERLAAARTAAAVAPVATRGILRVHGKDRQSFLHRMGTQKIAGLAPGVSVHVAFLDVKAHVVAEGRLLVRSDDLIVDVEPAAVEPLRAHLSRYVIMDQVRLEDVSSAWRVVTALGPLGIELARAHAAADRLWENPRRGAPAVDALLPPDDADRFRDALVSAGAVALGEEDLEVIRVMAGIPRFGVDVDPTRLVMETGLVRSAVSFEKGCYLGQEVVLRGTFRGQVQRGLVQLGLPAGAREGAALTAGGVEVGVITSAVDTPDGRLGLGYVRRAHWNAGERLSTSAGEAVVRTVLVDERDAVAPAKKSLLR